MIHLVETGEGDDLSFGSRVGVFLKGYWGDAQGLELSSLIPGQACTLSVAWKAFVSEARPQDVVLAIYAPAKSAAGLGEALFELSGAKVQDGLLRVEWIPPESPGAWPGGTPSRLLFVPRLAGWGVASASQPWQHPIADLEVARILRSGWERGSESAGQVAKVEVAIRGLAPGPVTFSFTYLVGATEVSLEGLEDVESELSTESVPGEKPEETLASAEWKIPLPRLLREAVERAGLDPAAEETSDGLLLPDPTPAPRRRHTLRFRAEAGGGDEALCAYGDLDVEEVDDVFVRCVEASQSVLSGAEVHLCEVSGEPRGEALQTNAEGEVHWEGVPIGPYVLHVQTEAGFSFSERVLSRRPEAPQPALVVAPPQFEARIRVVDEEQVALANAEVRLCDSLGGDLGAALTTDEAGEALWGAIPLRECVVEVFKEGDEDREALRFSSPVSLREVEEEVQAQPCWILVPPLHRAFVRVVDHERKLLEGTATLCYESGEQVGEQKTLAEGEACWKGVTPGSYVLDVQQEDFHFSAPLALRPLEGEVQPCEVIAPEIFQAPIRAVNANQEALVGAEVRLCREEGEQIGDPKTTDDQGDVAWDKLSMGDYVAEIFHEELRYSAPVALRSSGEVVQPCFLIAPQVYQAPLRAVNANQEALVGAEVRLCREEGAQIGDPKTTDDQGDVVWDKLSMGEYVAEVLHEGLRYSAPVGLRASGEAAQPCFLIAPEVYQAPLRVVNADQEALSGAEVRLCREEGEQIGDPKTADGQGDVVWDKLPMGEYVADVLHEGLRYSAPVGLRASGEVAQPCFLVAPQVYRAQLRVVNADQEALAGAEVRLCREEGEQIGEPKTADGQGDVVWDKLPVGEYVADVVHEGLRYSAPVGLRASGESAQPCYLVAPETYQALVRVLDSEQESLPSTQVRLCLVGGEQVGETQTTDSQGVVSWRDLNWDDYVVQVAAERAFSSPISLRLQGGSPAPCVVLAPRVLQASVRVLDEEGQPIGGATVALHRSTGRKVGATRTTDGQGQAKWDVDHDDYVVHVSHGGRSFSSPISLRSDPSSQPCLVVEPLPL